MISNLNNDLRNAMIVESFSNLCINTMHMDNNNCAYDIYNVLKTERKNTLTEVAKMFSLSNTRIRSIILKEIRKEFIRRNRSLS